MIEVSIFFLFISMYFTQSQNIFSTVKISHTNQRSKVTSEQIREYRDKMFWMLRKDFANLEKYKNENEIIKQRTKDGNRVVFFGNSITKCWEPYLDTHFPNKEYINRGIAG